MYEYDFFYLFTDHNYYVYHQMHMEHQLLIGDALVRFLVVLDSLMFVHKVLSRICMLVHWKDEGSVEPLEHRNAAENC